MHVGCPKEIKPQEFRVGLTPDAVQELVGRGHRVSIQAGAGTGAGFTDPDYSAAGAEIGCDRRQLVVHRRVALVTTSIPAAP